MEIISLLKYFMKRKTFITFASIIAIIVGLFSLIFPDILLESKGVIANNWTNVWTREVWVILIGVGIIAFIVRNHKDSDTLKAFLIGNVFIQIGLFTIEVIAYWNWTITKISWIIPNSIIHVILSIWFTYYAIKIPYNIYSKNI